MLSRLGQLLTPLAILLLLTPVNALAESPSESTDIISPSMEVELFLEFLSEDICDSLCFDGGTCMGDTCACNTATPGEPFSCEEEGSGGSGPGGSCPSTCSTNDDCLGCTHCGAPDRVVCASWGSCECI